MEKIEMWKASDGTIFKDPKDAGRYEGLLGKIPSEEDYLWVHGSEARSQYKYIPVGSIKFKEFGEGDIIHAIDWHCLEDPEGNDVDQEVDFVNPKILTGTYRVESKNPLGGYNCICLENVWKRHAGTTAYVGNVVILENYESKN